MLNRLHSHLRHNVVAYIALFVALGGTGAYAANTIRSEDIVNGEVKRADIGGNAVAADELDSFAVGTGELATKGVTSSKLADGSVGGRATANDSLTGGDVLESGLGTVPDADELDGRDSSEFLQGAGERVAEPTQVIEAGEADEPVISLPIGSVVGDCTNTQGVVSLTLTYKNLASGPQSIVRVSASEGTAPTTDGATLVANTTHDVAFAGSATANFGRWVELQAGGAGTTIHPSATFRISAVTRAGGTNDCAVIAEAVG